MLQHTTCKFRKKTPEQFKHRHAAGRCRARRWKEGGSTGKEDDEEEELN
jgi:hypothetical protein